MQLTQFTDYSLRMLMYLAESPDRLSTINEVAERFGISKQHLAKVAHNLAKLGYIKSIQGKGGGISLSKLPSEINIGQLIRTTEPHLHIVECFDKERNSCVITGKCKLRHVLHEATAQFFHVMDKHTLHTITTKAEGDYT